MDKFTSRLKFTASASRASIAEAQLQIGHHFPSDYIEFLNRSNGAKGWVGESFLVLWSVEELVQYNAATQVNHFAPGLLLFGGDGGGEVYGFDMRAETAPVVQVPLIPLAWEEAIICGDTFTEFLEHLYHKHD